MKNVEAGTAASFRRQEISKQTQVKPNKNRSCSTWLVSRIQPQLNRLWGQSSWTTTSPNASGGPLIGILKLWAGHGKCMTGNIPYSRRRSHWDPRKHVGGYWRDHREPYPDVDNRSSHCVPKPAILSACYDLKPYHHMNTLLPEADIPDRDK